MSDNELDNLFKEAADGFKVPKDPSAWKDMSGRLDQAGVGTSVFWNWKAISAITAVGIIASSSLVWVASQKSSDQSIAKNTSPSGQTESTLKSNQSIQDEATETNATPVQKEQSDISSNTREGQKSISESKSMSTTVDASETKTIARSSQEPMKVSVDGGNQNKTTQRTDSKVAPSNSSSAESAKELETEQQKLTRNENRQAVAVVLPGGGAVIKGSVDTEATIAPSNISADNKVRASEESQQKVTRNENQQADAVFIPTGAAVIKGSAGTETTIAPSNASTESKSKASELNQKKSVVNENQPAKAKVIPAGVIVASESNVLKTEKQNVIGDEKQISSSSTESAVRKNVSESDRANQITSANEVVTDSVVKPLEDLPVVAERTDSELEKASTEKKSLGKGLSVKAIIAPDYATVGNTTPNKLGISYGLLFEYRLSNNWSLATGGIWSKKIYTAKNVEYNSYTADWVDGDCRMWDIPVNVYYTFSPSRQFSFYAGLGLSSYIMNEENYVMYYETPNGTWDYPLQVKGKNNEWFKTLNASIGMQLRLTNSFTLQVEPTVKAPLAGVGEGEVSLASFGAFLNLRYDIPIRKQEKRNGE